MTRRAKGRRDQDLGAALIMVIGLGLVMMLLVTTGLTVVTSGLRQAATNQDSVSALDAAYAGVQDYLTHVNVDPNYVRYGNPAADFSAGSAVSMPTTSNAAFGVGAEKPWATVPGSGDHAGFRYEIDNSAYTTTGVVRARVTGMSGRNTRTLVASLRVRGFVDYIYFTDYEMQDPNITGALPSCVLHAWEGRAASCGRIRFGRNDLLTGPIHSNDTLVICGATLTGAVTTANTGTPLYDGDGCSNGPINITRAAKLPMPATNASMREDAGCLYTGPTTITYNPDGTMTVISPWTQYTQAGSSPSNPDRCGGLAQLQSASGATVPQLTSDLLYVQNVPKVDTDPNYWAPESTPPRITCLAADGSPSGGGDGIGWAYGKSDIIVSPILEPFPVVVTPAEPDSELAPAASTELTPTRASDAEARAAATEKSSTRETTALPDDVSVAVATESEPVDAQVTAAGGLSSISVRRGGLRHPLALEVPPTDWRNKSDATGLTWDTITPAYGCRNGDLFVQGTVTTQTTAASANYVYVTGDILYGDKAADVLGLVGQNAVLVHNPVGADGQALLKGTNREIDAAILSVAHTFQVQNYDRGGDRGQLSLFGSIAQKFRGPVASIDELDRFNGYAKAYGYDPLLTTVSPPKFLAPSATSFVLIRYTGVAAAFTAAGRKG